MGIPPVGMSFEDPQPIKVVQEENTWCPKYDKSGDYEDFKMIRKVYFTVWNSMVKGFYKTGRKSPVSEECMGDWMDTLKNDIEETLNLLDDGKFSEITADKLKKITSGIIDVFYKNWEVCGVYSTV